MYISDITLLANENKTDVNRYIGGSDKTVNDHPFIKGYFYVFFGFPTTLFGDAAGMDAKSAQKYLLTSAESFTPPGDRQINLQDMQGQGGVDSSFITGQTITRDFSIQYKDYWGSPVFRIHKRWTNYINPYLGVSEVADSFSANEYKGICMVIQTKPVARKGASGDDKRKAWTKADILKVHLFDGVQCTTDFSSIYDANVTDNSFVKPTAQYKFDGYPLDETDPATIETALKVLQNANMFDKTSELYKNLAKTESILQGDANTSTTSTN